MGAVVGIKGCAARQGVPGMKALVRLPRRRQGLRGGFNRALAERALVRVEGVVEIPPAGVWIGGKWFVEASQGEKSVLDRAWEGARS